MKHTYKRVLALLLALIMLTGCLASCGDNTDGGKDGDKGETTRKLDNGNIVTAVEQGTEEELTAVREELIKYTEIEGFATGAADLDKMELYENGVRTASDEYWQVKDNKKFYYKGDTKRVVNYPDGYILDIPADWQPDFTLSTARSVYQNDEVTLVVSDETDALKIYGDSQSVVDVIFQFINTDNYRQKNRVTLIQQETKAFDDEFQMFVLKQNLEETLEGTKSYYTYVVFYSELKITYMMFKCVDDRDFSDIYMSYKSIFDKGSAVDTLAYPEGGSDSWSDATKALYEEIKNTDHVIWGMVNGNIDESPLKMKYPMLENKVDFKFPIVTTYTDQLSYDFPVDKAQQITDDGRIIQFTYHYDYAYGNTMGQNSPILDVYRGELDDEFREFAQGVVEYGQPMLFRLNNEMNSDWTSWAAVNAMCDPDIFVATWQRMYQIFEEEGANQYLIWVLNPQGRSTGPMCNWNDLRLYFPGADYMHMLGLTGYNFGDDNQWTSFRDMYAALEEYYLPMFGDWAWIIGEFGCSDSSELEENANRKAEWITDMFDCFEEGLYPNIKAAVWFNGNDYDGSGNITHEIALGRDQASLDAFKDGLERTQP